MTNPNPTHGGMRAGSGRKPPPRNTIVGRVYIGRIDQVYLNLINSWLTPAARKAALLNAARLKASAREK